MWKPCNKAVSTSLSFRQLLLVATGVGLAFVAYSVVFGSGDIEEAANSSYSIGALSPERRAESSESGIQTILGVPVYDIAQGTGDRLPYQASWAQSVTWPLRFVVTSEWYSLVRTFIYLVAGLVVFLTTLRSWLPSLTVGLATLFAVLANSSYGLFLRQNDWSDHYVQVVGIAAFVMFLMRREFHGSEPIMRGVEPKLLLACLFVSVNGVVTGHPGLWPVALFVWLSFTLVLLTEEVFRRSIAAWIRNQASFVVVAIGASTVTAAVVAIDLLAELSTETWTTGRLSRTQGLFSEFAFGGLYGLSSGGALPEELKRVVSSILATVVMPGFMMLDPVLPQLLRASDFREMPRVEFTGSLVLLAFAMSWRALAGSPMRKLIVKVVACQAIIWLFVVLSVIDRLPPVLASSGAWMTLTVVLIINVFVSFLVLGTLPRRSHVVRGSVAFNVALIGYWFLFQFGFSGFGSVLQAPERNQSRFESVEALAESEWYSNTASIDGRVLMVSTPSLYDFLPFVSLGYSVVAPADPKTRASGQLQSNFAFNFSINPPDFETMTSEEIDRTLDFLQVKYVLVGAPSVSDAPRSALRSEGLQSVLAGFGKPEVLALPHVAYEVYSRSQFSAFVASGATTTRSSVCSVLFEACPVVTESTQLVSSTNTRLQQCWRDCLWTFRAPAVSESDVLMIPVTYDSALNVRDERGTQLDASDVGGFLGIAGPNGIGEGELTVTLDPDIRTLSRMFVSYLGLGVFVMLLGAIPQPWVQSRRRRLRVE